mgnify:CR=1 FL=1
MKTVELQRITLLDDYCKTKTEGDSNLELCISIISRTMISILKDAEDDDAIDTSLLYNLTHVLRELETMKLEIDVFKEGGEA